MTVRVYRSTDAGAPTLNGLAGSLISVLNACLVTGYGALAGSGWSMPYTGTNTAAFRQPATANQRYLNVVDTTGATAAVAGYEDMSSISSGTGRFPNVGQASSGLYFPKSTTADATSRPWMMIATDKIFHFWVAVGTTSYFHAVAFGDFVSTVANDTYNTILIANAASSYSTATDYSRLSSNLATTTAAHYVARPYTQNGESLAVAVCSDYSRSGATSLGNGGMPYPNPADNKVYVAPIIIGENSGGMTGIWRGTLPGLWHQMHAAASFVDGDVITDVVGATGKVFEVHGLQGTAVALFEISNTW